MGPPACVSPSSPPHPRPCTQPHGTLPLPGLSTHPLLPGTYDWHQARSLSRVRTRSWVGPTQVWHFLWGLGKVLPPPRAWISVKKHPDPTGWARRVGTQGSQATPRPLTPPHLTASTWACPQKSSCSSTHCFLCHPPFLPCRLPGQGLVFAVISKLSGPRLVPGTQGRPVGAGWSNFCPIRGGGSSHPPEAPGKKHWPSPQGP